jgi:uncharacterized repeat protein (TIGR03803 family)
MGKSSCWKATFTGLVILAATTMAAPAQTYTTLASFDLTDGADPEYGPLVQGFDGNFYGTTYDGGASDDGTVFKVSTEGQLTSLYSFCIQTDCADGFLTWAGLTLGFNGNLYGLTFTGGADSWGTVFTITPTGKLTTLHNFCSLTGCTDGGAPQTAMILGSDLNFYGTAYGGNALPPAAKHGTVFKITPGGTLTTLYTFSGPDGSAPTGPMVQASNGNFYGTTGGGGAHGRGTVFQITAAGKLTTLHSFSGPDGSGPVGPMVQATDGNFYGTTAQGGANQNCTKGCGTVFKMTPEGNLTVQHSFDGADGSYVIAGLIQGTDGNFYGVTEEGGNGTACGTFGCGTIFEFTPPSTLTTLHSFQGPADGSFPAATLLQATNGNFYGISIWGGNGCDPGSVGCGTVFSLSTGLGPFVSFVNRAAKVAQAVEILGQGFTGTTKVAFNGLSASFTVLSDTSLRATVPTGAITGFVTVTTPGGKLTSNVPFRVLP